MDWVTFLPSLIFDEAMRMANEPDVPPFKREWEPVYVDSGGFSSYCETREKFYELTRVMDGIRQPFQIRLA